MPKHSNIFAYFLSALFVMLAAIQAINLWHEASIAGRVQLGFANDIPSRCRFIGNDIAGKRIANYIRDLTHQREAVQPIIAITYDRINMVIAIDKVDSDITNHIHYLLAKSVVQGPSEENGCYSETQLQNILKGEDKKIPLHFIESSKVDNPLSLLNGISLMFNLVIAYVIYRMRPTS